VAAGLRRGLPWVALVACISVPVLGTISLVVALIALFSLFEVSRQLSAFVGRQSAAILAAIVAPAATIAVWSVVGVDSVELILLGYLAGYCVQSGASWWVARRAVVAPATERTARLWGPVTWASTAQANSMFDRFLLVDAPSGFAGSSNFCLNATSAAALVIAAPLASEAVAGRRSSRVPRRVLLVGAAAVGVSLALMPSLMRVVAGGGAVEGARFDLLVRYARLYVLTIVPVAYWSYRSRVLLAHQASWATHGVIGCAMLVVHVAIGSAAYALGAPEWVPLGWVVAASLGAWCVTETGVRKVDRLLTQLRSGTN
jgi:hypothetical protein